HGTIILAVLDESRKVVVEGEMNDAIGSRGTFLQAVRICDGPAIDLGAGGGQGRRLVVRSTKAEHLMARSDQLLDDGRADESGGSGNEYAHSKVSWFRRRQVSSGALSW